MNNCWKCGKQTAEGAVECRNCEIGIPPEIAALSQAAFALPPPIELSTIDWTKIKTFEQLLEVLKILNPHIPVGCQAHKMSQDVVGLGLDQEEVNLLGTPWLGQVWPGLLG